MKRRFIFFVWVSVGLCVFAAGAMRGTPAKKPLKKRPNVILISIDTLRADHLGCYGYGKNTTPTLDAFAREAWLFENAFSTSPWTLPAHMAMLTGVIPPVQHPSDVTLGIHSALPTLTKLFKAANYRTGGWADFVYFNPKNGFGKNWTYYDDEGAARIFPEALEWIAKPRKSFFLFLHVYDPHYPFEAPEKYRFRFNTESTVSGQRKVKAEVHINTYSPLSKYRSIEKAMDDYDAEIYNVDEQLRLFFQGLKDLGLWDETVIMVTSDHGESFLDHGIRFGHGLFMYDEVLRIPLLLKRAGAVKPRRFRPNVSMLDIYPTLLEAAEIPVPPTAQGFSLIGLLDGTSLPKREIFSRSSNIGGNLAIRFDGWKWIEAPRYTLMILKARINGKWDLLTSLTEFRGPETVSENIELPRDFWPQDPIGRFIEGNIPQSDRLFRVSEDPLETKNLIESRPEVAARAQALAAEVRSEWGELLLELNKKQKGKRKAPKLSEEEKERLRSLGYLN